ncbi:MAG TPA: two-component regulator propeller domain-containing protein, partial [Candidatus Thermoplasmatota archaeon]|nr:two-component regulator propeller domain-containing protein [Candidatus Thermoplasmatota archaeon]
MIKAIIHISSTVTLIVFVFNSAFAQGIWKTYSEKDNLALFWVHSIAVDNDGVLWFGTTSGLSSFDGEIWKTYTKKDGLASNNIWTIAQDNEGVMWFGYGYDGFGVTSFDGTIWKTYTWFDGLVDNEVYDIAVDKSGAKWFATHDGVSKFDGNTWTSYTEKNSELDSNYENVIYIDSIGNIWFGTIGDLQCFDGIKWKNYNGLAGCVFTIAEDHDGLMWFADPYNFVRSVSSFDGNIWKYYTKDNSGLLDNSVRAIAVDMNGVIWFGTTERGVTSFDGTNWKSYHTYNSGLVSNVINAITVDNMNVKWFATDKGVSSFDDRAVEVKNVENFPTTMVIESIKAYPIKSPIKVDGFLDDPDWENAELITDFTQREPTEGAPASEKTEVRILYDMDNLYIGVVCFDSKPDKIVCKELQWDFDVEKSDDSFTVVIDTYNDKRMGMYLSVNPNGARFDATFESNSRRLNKEWNGIWDVASRITDQGWSCEIIIPFKTLRFPNTDTQVWGINFMRMIRRKNEEVLWSGWSRNDGIRQLSKAGALTIAEPVTQSNQIEVKPYNLAGVENVLDHDINNVFKYGLDAKIGITSNTILTLSAKTDFAQIESDKEKINLTQFDLMYPEKRDFFLEGSETFSFSMGRDNLFYSRNIGISPDLEQIPILGGAKLTQKSGSFRLGVLTMQTQKKDGYPSANYTVARVRKDILKQSYIGFIGTSVYDANHHDNQVYGFDVKYKTDTLFGNRNLEVDGLFAGTITDG